MQLKPPPFNKYPVIISILVGLLVLYFIFEADWFLYAGTAVALLSLLSGKLAHYIALSWMWFGAVMGYINGHLLLTLIFFLILTPLALLNRLFGKQKLQMKAGNAESNWQDRSHTYTAKDLGKPF